VRAEYTESSPRRVVQIVATPITPLRFAPARLARMWNWARRQYAKRIVNINVNIIVAGVLAIILTAIPLHLSRYFGVKDDDKTIILIITAVSDWVFDLAIVTVLHWLANHWPKKLKGKELVEKAEDLIESAPPQMPFLKDTTIIQLQRACLSPLLYAIALGMQWWLLHIGVAREPAGIAGFITGILICRVIHTIWLIRSDRKVLEEWEAKKAARLAELARERAQAEKASEQPRSEPEA
jgi:hypothetical protein